MYAIIIGRGYFAGLEMTSRPNNVGDVMTFLPYLQVKNEKRAKSLDINL